MMYFLTRFGLRQPKQGRHGVAMNPKKSSKCSGFTLTEIIVSIVVLGLIIGGAVRTFGVALQLHGQNEQRVTAAYLAQECLEIIRNTRDTNWLQNRAWDHELDSLPAPFDTDFVRKVDVKTLDEDKRRDPEAEAWDNSEEAFIITPTSKEFICIITWADGDFSLSASSILTNWQQ